MPTYEYLCQSCAHRFETWQKMTDEALTVCPECGGHIRRVLYAAGVVFKGSGFYKTDHGSGALPGTNGNKPEADKEKKASTDAPPAESKPAESKPAESKSSTGENKVAVSNS